MSVFFFGFRSRLNVTAGMRPRHTRSMSPALATVALVLLATVGLTGCTRSTDRETSSAAAADSTPDSLVIYTYDAFPGDLEEALATHLRETEGIALTLERFTDTGGLYNEVLLTRNEVADGGGADLVIGLDSTYVGPALAEGLFEAYTPEAIGEVNPALRIDPTHRLIPFDYGNIVLNYDSETLADPPTTWEGLLDPALAESIILMNPATSSPGRNFLLMTVAHFGEEGWLDFWRELRPNILTVTSGWSDGYGLYSQGEAPIVVSYETSPAYHIAYEGTERYRNLILDGTGYAQIEVMGITAGAPNRAAAQLAVEFVLSREFQELIPLNQFMWPVRDDVTLPDAFLQLERPTESLFLDVATVDANWDRWLAAWEEAMR